MRRGFTFRSVILAAIVCGVCPPAASARVVLITRGETISHVADIPNPAKEKVRADFRKLAKRDTQPAVGFAYKYWGIFWLDFWRWDGRFCIYEDRDLYVEPPVEFLAGLVGKSADTFTKPFFYRFPPGLVVVAGFILLGVLCAVFKKSPVQQAQALVQDARYERALEIIAEELEREEQTVKAGSAPAAAPSQPQAPSRPPFEAAVDYLVSQGVPRDEAQTNLALILTNTRPLTDAAEADSSPA